VLSSRAAIPPAASSSGEPPGSAPGSNPESEQEFFEAGDDGTYAGGPRSVVPVPVFEVDAIEPVGTPPPRLEASRRPRTRRGTTIVVGLLLVAAVPLIVAAWRQMTAARDAEVTPELSTVASQPSVTDPVKQSGNGDGTVAPAAGRVSPLADSVANPADAAPPSAVDGSPAVAEGVAPAVPAEPAADVRIEPRPAAVVPKAPVPAVVRAHAAPRKNVAAAAEPSTTLETPFIPPFKAAPPQPVTPPKGAEPRPGDKPPTAAYPLH
jgi:hypothetical protein